MSGNRNTSRWTVTTARLMPIKNRARNRAQAVAGLLDAYQRAAGVW